MTPLFPPLSDHARLWIYAADRPLSEPEQADLLQPIRMFIGSWASHGRPVRGGADVWHGRFLLVAGEVEGGAISGCGIDASVRAVEAAGERLGIRWLSPLDVLYRDAVGAVRSLPRAAFRKLVRAGEVTAATPVFDLTLAALGDVRRGHLERPAGEAWHALVFRIPQPAL